nr:MAG TPA: hypothetical protein [Caudoviricetes sp.]
MSVFCLSVQRKQISIKLNNCIFSKLVRNFFKKTSI